MTNTFLQFTRQWTKGTISDIQKVHLVLLEGHDFTTILFSPAKYTDTFTKQLCVSICTLIVTISKSFLPFKIIN